MKKAIIKNLKLPYPDFNWDMVDEETKLLERIEEQKHLFGKPERWVREKITSQDEYGDAIYIYPDEQYDDEDIIGSEERPTGNPIINEDGTPKMAVGMEDFELQEREPEEWVWLRAEYTIEIEDYNPVPQSISPAQARMALAQNGLLDTVETAVSVSAISVQIYWKHATEFRRDNQMLNDMASQLGLTQAQLDDIFRLGATF
jgi:hypothetical protein